MDNKNITIGIEGLVGAGKTSLCRELLDYIPNSILLHGGNLYRGIIIAVMNSKIDLKKMASESSKKIDIKDIMDMLKVEIKIIDRESVVYVDGTKVDEDELQSTAASIAVSAVARDADNSKLYEFAKHLIDGYKQKYNVIISGRDLMKIYPELDYHFFIVADLDARIERKANQYSDVDIDFEQLKQHILKRDKLQEESGFYKRYDNTIDVDVTNCKSAKESAEKVLEYIKLPANV